MTLDEKRRKYLDLCHAMQSGVAFKMNYEPDGETIPKHLRVGINTAMSDHGALVALLIEKGLITEDDYCDKLIEFMEREVASYQQEIAELTGANITLR